MWGRRMRAGQTRRRGTRHLVLLTMPEMLAARHLYVEAGFGRLPDRDGSPVPGVTLLAYGRVLGGN
jgi:hypothetical protein